ncbi:MAG: hypothetical protein HC938_09650 [Nitrospira sp.]|nr:hypothetical protein [Nitrospira sp.]
MFQKPILAVEHHGFFRSGHKELARLVQGVSSLSGKVMWMPLGTVVLTHCLVRRTGDKQLALRHFSSQLFYKNFSQYCVALSIEKPEQERKVKAVVIGDQDVPFSVHAGLLKYSANLGAGEELRAKIIYHETYRPARSVSWQYRLAASARRLMSELRDNQLARNERLLSLAERMKKMWSAGARQETERVEALPTFGRGSARLGRGDLGDALFYEPDFAGNLCHGLLVWAVHCTIPVNCADAVVSGSILHHETECQ